MKFPTNHFGNLGPALCLPSPVWVDQKAHTVQGQITDDIRYEVQKEGFLPCSHYANRGTIQNHHHAVVINRIAMFSDFISDPWTNIGCDHRFSIRCFADKHAEVGFHEGSNSFPGPVVAILVVQEYHKMWPLVTNYHLDTENVSIQVVTI